MTEKIFYKLNAEFERYVLPFLRNGRDGADNHRVKYLHTEMVVDIAAEIAQSLGLGENSILLCKTIALLHDLGRFEQFELYGTFSDARSVNHAELAVSILEREDLLYRLSAGEKRSVYKAILNHNRLVIEDDLTDEEMLYCKIIRDADKVDIYRVVCNDYLSISSNKVVGLDLPDYDKVTDFIYEKFLNRDNIMYSELKTLNDFKLLQIGWLNDLNFTHSLKMVFDMKYPDIICDTLTDRGKMAEVKDFISKFRSDSGVSL